MDVLTKDLAAVGVRASYDVDFALTADGKNAERTGMFHMTTAMTPEQWFKEPSKEMCIYTNPNSTTWASNETPVILKNAVRSPESNDMPPGEALKAIGDVARNRALEQN